MTGYLTVVFDRNVPASERTRLLDSIGLPACSDEGEADAYCVEVELKPGEQLYPWAERYANLGSAVVRVSYTRPLKDLEK